MSFRVHARHVRDPALPFGRRYRALTHAANCYCPLGFRATWAYLGTAGDLRKDESALLRALGLLEVSRAVWLAEAESFAAHRRTEKARHRRTPRQSETRYLLGWRWPGPDGKQATLGEVGRLWAVHRRTPFPEVPPAEARALAELDTCLTGCASAYAMDGGHLAPVRQSVLAECLPQLRRRTAALGYPSGAGPLAFGYFRRLLKMTELIHHDTTPVPWQ
ncbi:hypothetical protein [Streptomyces sp. NPDC058045]|uniref:hypothetical protein n=1 Tax=Streptomyces sp. NPDC058045 TaxID=3346311 RepID=UPI0036EB119C